MKRLFCIKDGKRVVDGLVGSKIVPDGTVFYDNKATAKQVRDELGGIDAGYHVSRGPDHIGKHSGYHMPSMRRQPKHVAS